MPAIRDRRPAGSGQAGAGQVGVEEGGGGDVGGHGHLGERGLRRVLRHGGVLSGLFSGECSVFLGERPLPLGAGEGSPMRHVSDRRKNTPYALFFQSEPLSVF